MTGDSWAPNDPDLQRIASGEIPWSPEEFYEVMEWELEMRETPQDDWDRRRRGFTLLGEAKGSAAEYRVNPDHPGNQVVFYFQERYAAEPDVIWGSHWFRYTEIKSFFSDYMNRLLDEGLAFEDPDEDAVHVHQATAEVLCTIEYNGTRVAGGEEHRSFDVEEVIERSLELKAGAAEE